MYYSLFFRKIFKFTEVISSSQIEEIFDNNSHNFNREFNYSSTTRKVKWFPPRRYRCYTDYVWEGFRIRNVSTGHMSFSRSSDLIRAYRRGSKKQISSKQIPGSRTIYENLHSPSEYYRKKKLLEIFAAFHLAVFLLIGAPAYNLYQLMSVQDQQNFRPLAKNQDIISSPLPFYDQLLDGFFRILMTTTSYISHSNLIDELRNYVPNYSEFFSPELGTLSESQTGREFSYSKAEATVEPLVLQNFFKFFTGTVIAFLYIKRLSRPVTLHDCNFKVNQLQKFTLSEKSGKTIANLSFFTPFRPYAAGNIFKRWSEIKYDLMMTTKSFDVHGGVSIEKFFLEYVIYKDTINLSLINYFKC